jgi:hypothetical protein
MANEVSIKILIQAVNEAKAVLNDIRQDVDKTQSAFKNLNADNSDKVQASLKGVAQEAAATKAATQDLGKTVGGGLASVNDALNGIKTSTQGGKQALGDIANAASGLEAGFGKLYSGVKLLTGGFLAIKGIDMAFELLKTAARVETLSIVLRTIGQNAGYTVSQLETADRAVQKLGITAEASRQSLSQLIQSGISLDLAKPLARAAQDLAVVSGLNSSETFSRLITNIQQLDTLGLRFMGIIVDRETAFANAAAETGKAITGNLQKQVLANAVLAEATKLAGIYEASMASAGKQLTSFSRYIDDFKAAVGALGQGVFLELIKGAGSILKALTDLASAFKETTVNTTLFGEGAEGAYAKVGPLSQAIRALADAVTTLIKAMTLLAEPLKFAIDLATTASVVFARLMGGLGAVEGLSKLGQGLIDMFKGSGEEANKTASFWERASQALEKFRNIMGVSSGAPSKGKVEQLNLNQAVDEYVRLLGKQAVVMKEVSTAADDFNKASNKNAAASPAEKANAEKELQAALQRKEQVVKQKKELDDLQQQLTSRINSFGELQEGPQKERLKVAQQAYADAIKSAKEEMEFMTFLGKSLEVLGTDTGEFLRGVSNKLAEQLSSVRHELEAIGKAGVDAQLAVKASLAGLETAGAQVKTPEGLKAFASAVDAVKKKSTELGVDISTPLSNLTAVVENDMKDAVLAAQLGGEKVRQALIAQAQRKTDVDTQFAVTTQNLRRLANEKDLEILRFGYDQGLVLQKDYYQARVNFTRTALEDEVRVNNAALTGLYAQLRFTANDNQRAEIEAKIAAIQSRNGEAFKRQANDELRIITEGAQARIKLETDVANLRISINEELGHKEEAIRAKGRLDLQAQLIALGALASEEDKALVVKRNTLEVATRLRDVEFERLNKSLDLQRALIDLEDAKTRSSFQDGDVTSLDAQEKLNGTIVRRIELLKEQREATLKARDEALALGQVDIANGLNKQAVELTAQMYTLRDSITSVGRTLQDTFVNSFTDNFTAILNGTKSFKQGMLDIFKDLNTQILKTITKDIAEDFVKGLNSLTKGADGKGGGFFDNLGSLLTGKKPKEELQLGTESRPMWTKNADPKEKAVADGKVSTPAEAMASVQQDMKSTADYTRRTADATEKLANQIKNEVEKAPATVQGSKTVEAGGDAAFKPDGSGPRGIRNNNPGNLVQSSIPFQGKVPGTDSRFETFDTPENGIRALDKNLIAYQEKYGINTVKGVIERWAPKSENNTEAYVSAVAKEMGVKADEVIDLKDQKTLEALSKAIIRHENGQQPYSDSQISAGASSALGKSPQSIADDKTVTGRTANGNPFAQGTITSEPQSIAERTERSANGNPSVTGKITEATDTQVKSVEAATKSTDALTQSQTKAVDALKPLEKVDIKSQEVTEAKADALEPSGTPADPISVTVTNQPAANDPTATTSGYSAVDQAALDKKISQVSGTKDNQGSLTGTLLGFAPALGAALGGKLGGGSGATIGALIGQAIGKIDPKTIDKLFSGLDTGLSKGFEGLGSLAKGGDLGIGSFFSNFGSKISELFSSLSGGSGGGSSGGGFGGLLSSIFGGGGGSGANWATAATGVEDLGLFLAEGGDVSGPGTGTSDGVPAWLSQGEFVVNSMSTKKYRGLLKAINAEGNGGPALELPVPRIRLAMGGEVGASNDDGFRDARTGVVASVAAARGGVRGAARVTVVQHISTPDVGSFRRSQAQIAVDSMRVAQRAIRRDS